MTTTTYEFTAYAEQDLLDAGSGNGSNLGCGDTFTMPDGATVCFEVKDNDAFLSGDNYCNENANDHSYQTASITDAASGNELGNGGQIYAECYHWVHDDAGNWYVMIEIEQEGTGDDYFTFYNGYGYETPAEGTELTVHSSCNVKGSWVDFKCLDAGEKPPATGSISGRVFCDEDCDGIDGGVQVIEGCDYTIEAESMDQYGFHTVSGAHASGGELVKLSHYDCYGVGDGDLKTNFNGKDGVYDLKIRVQDECDGESKIFVKINGVQVGVVRLNQNTDGAGNDDGGFSTFTIPGVTINDGDEILLWVDGRDGEFVRIDNIILEGQDQVIPYEEPGKEGILVTLLDADGNEVLGDDGNPITTLTDADGNYTFDDVPQGDYRVKFTNPDGTEFTLQNEGSDDTIDSDANADGVSDVFSVVGGAETSNIDAGLKEEKLGSLSGRYFCDENRDGLDNDGLDKGVGDILVELLDENGAPTGRTTTTSTDPDTLGNYSFGDLEAGTYGVRFIDQLTGKVLTTQNVDDDVSDDIDSDAAAIGDPTNGVSEINGIVVTAGNDTPDNDAGVVEQPGALSGRYFCDENRNDIDDEDVATTAVAGKTVTLFLADGVTRATDIDGTLVDAVQTDSDGGYRFDNLAAGDYVVMFEDSAAETKTFVAPNVGDNGTTDAADDSDVIDAANGKTAPVSVVAGQETENVDAGVVELLGSLSGRYFCDENRDGTELDDNGNPEVGVGGVLVTLLDASGNPVLDAGGNPVTTTTDPVTGNYQFTGLVAGTYGVLFADTVSGKTLIAPDVNGNANDDIDSDAVSIIDPTSGLSEITGIQVNAGQNTPDNDAGVENLPPEIDDESGEVCYDETVTIDLIDVNDIDPEGAALNLVAIDGIDVSGLAEGDTVTLDNGVIITLGPDGDITVDGEGATVGGEATADLLAGESAVDTFTYTLSDGTGGTATANVEVAFKGATDSIDKVAQILTDQGLLGNEICFQLTNGPDLEELFTMQITGTGNPLLDGIFAEAYCVAVAEPLQTGQGGLDFSDAPELKGTLHLALPGMIPNDSLNPIFPGVGIGVNGEAAEDNLDLVNWIVNQDFGSVDNGDGTGTTYTDAEIQGAIWGLTDGFAFVNGEGGTQNNALEIVEFALNDQDMDGVGAADLDGFDEGGAEGFEPLIGDKVALFLNPTAETEALGHSQPFIFAVDLFEDCIC